MTKHPPSVRFADTFPLKGGRMKKNPPSPLEREGGPQGRVGVKTTERDA